MSCERCFAVSKFDLTYISFQLSIKIVTLLEFYIIYSKTLCFTIDTNSYMGL